MKIPLEFIEEAKKSTEAKYKHLYHKHTFVNDTDEMRYEHLYRGKLGEKLFKTWLISKGIPFVETDTPPEEPDTYDFMIYGKTVDVKAVKPFHKYLLEKKSLYEHCPKEVYVGCILDKDLLGGELLGWEWGEVMSKNNLNMGYVDDIGVKLSELKSMDCFSDIKTKALWEL